MTRFEAFIDLKVLNNEKALLLVIIELSIKCKQ